MNACFSWTMRLPALRLVGDAGDHDHLGPARYRPVPFHPVVPGAGPYVAWGNRQEGPTQRTARTVAGLAMRLMAGVTWFQGTIGKLPHPVCAGLARQLTQEGMHGAVPALGGVGPGRPGSQRRRAAPAQRLDHPWLGTARGRPWHGRLGAPA